MIIKHIMHSRERCFSYCHKNIKGEKHELKQKMKEGKKKAKIGTKREGAFLHSVFTGSSVPWDVWQPRYSEELHQQKKGKSN